MFVQNIGNLRYYCMVYNAMQSIESIYNGKYDLVVFYDKSIDIDKFYLNDEYNIKKDFPFVKFIKSDYDTKYSLNRVRPYKHDGYMSKWYHLQKVIEMGYDHVMFLDCDTVFIKDPSELFDKYDGNNLWTLSCTDRVHDMLFPDIPNMNSGQFILKTDKIKKKNLYKRIYSKRMLMSRIAKEKLYDKGKITDIDLSGYEYFNEQYCGQMVIMEDNIEYKELNAVEVVHPASPVNFLCDNIMKKKEPNPMYSVNLNKNGIADITDIRSDTYIIHYSSGKSVFWVDKQFRNQDLNNGYRNMYNKINNIGKETWELLFQ